MRTALKPGARLVINGTEYEIQSLLSASGGMSLIYEAQQSVAAEGFSGKTVIKEFFPATNARRDSEGRVVCASKDAADIERFESLRRSMIDEGIIGDDARQACSQVYAFDQAWNGYAVMRKLSRDTLSLTDILNAWQTNPPSTDEEYSDMARLRYALRITHSILTGLQTIHNNAGIIHRDISLGNIVWASADFARDGRDGRAYFLDFGSALRMNDENEAKNVTDPLNLFGTYSFAAPEIWKLGGPITPAADLFSVSAILLLLCCGKKCCIRMKPGWHLASQTNIGRLYENDYVLKSSLEKMNIPADIRGRLYDLLLQGLSKDPGRRFENSAIKMLEILETLQIKCAPRQRLREYIAFISYHHRPLDKAVAKRLHRMIEEYRIPKELVKDGKNNRLGHVFRDEDELPVSTDLTDNIQEALDHSEYLIVICTPGTPGSIWVEQEIRYFLRHHDRNHVLAVLAEGRPEESFPQHLVHLYDENEKIVGDTEYLAANITGNNRRKVLHNLNREKLRIIAAMLGCPYDSLYQREKRYQIQRFAAISGVAVVILMVISMIVLIKNAEISEKNQVIQHQYTEVLANESRALSREAQLKYQNGDMIGALECALSAVPDETNGRPYTPISEQVLSDVLDPYSFGTGRIKSILYQETAIKDVELDEDLSAVYTLDHYGYVRAFDIDSGAIKWTYELSADSLLDNSLSIFFLQDQQRIIAHSGKELTMLNCASGSVAWKIEQQFRSFQVAEDQQTLLVFDDAYSGSTRHFVAQFYSIDDGTLMRSVDCDAACLKDNLSSLQYAGDYIITEAVFQAQNCYYSMSYDYDSVRKTCDYLLYAIGDEDSVRLLKKVALEVENDDYPIPVALRYYRDEGALMLVMANVGAQKLTVEKISTEQGEVLYSKEFTWNTTYDPSIRCFASSNSHAFLGLDNDMFCFDVATGEILAKSMDNSANFGLIYMDENSGNTGYVVTDSGIYCLVSCINGTINFANFDHQGLDLGAIRNISLGKRDCLAPVSEGASFATGYVVEMNPNSLVAVIPSFYGNRVVIMQPQFGSEYYIDGLNVEWQEYLMERSGRFLIDRNNGYLFDLEEGREIELPGWNPRGDFDDISFSIAEQSITYFSDDSLCVYSLVDNKVSRFELEGIPDTYSKYPLSEATREVLLADEDTDLFMRDVLGGFIMRALTTAYLSFRKCAASAICADGTSFACLFGENKLSCWKGGRHLDIAQATSTLPEYSEAVSNLYYGSIKVLTDGEHVVIVNAESNTDPCLLIYNVTTDAWRAMKCEHLSEFLDSNSLEHAYCISEKTGRLAYITDRDELVIYDLDSCELISRTAMETSVRSIKDMRFFKGDSKLLCLEDNRAIEYDVSSGEMCECEFYHSFNGVTTLTSLYNISVDEKRHRLYISDPAGYGSGICIDMDSWSRIAYIPCQLSYSPCQDSVLTYDFPGFWHPNLVGYVSTADLPEGRCGICSVPAKSLQQLRQEGLSLLHMN